MSVFAAFIFMGFLGLFWSYHLHSQPVERFFLSWVEPSRHQRTEIMLIDKASPLKEVAIEDVLFLQKSLLVDPLLPIPEPNQKTGFLLMPMTPSFILSLLEEKEGMIIGAYQNENLVGYVLLTHADEFKTLYESQMADTLLDPDLFEEDLLQNASGYIEQIAIKPGYSRKGIGTLLINTCKKLKPDGLVSDVCMAPIQNEPTLRFLLEQGFTPLGTIYREPVDEFPFARQNQALIWKRPAA